MPESVCAPRICELTERLHGLKARRELLAEEPDEREPRDRNDRALLRAEVRQVLDGGPAEHVVLEAGQVPAS